MRFFKVWPNVRQKWFQLISQSTVLSKKKGKSTMLSHKSPKSFCINSLTSLCKEVNIRTWANNAKTWNHNEHEKFPLNTPKQAWMSTPWKASNNALRVIQWSLNDSVVWSYNNTSDGSFVWCNSKTTFSLPKTVTPRQNMYNNDSLKLSTCDAEKEVQQSQLSCKTSASFLELKSACLVLAVFPKRIFLRWFYK